MLNTGSPVEKGLCDQVFQNSFPGKSGLPGVVEIELFLQCGYITSHEKYSFLQQKTFTFTSLTHSIWHSVPSIVLTKDGPRTEETETWS